MKRQKKRAILLVCGMALFCIDTLKIIYFEQLM